MTTITVPAKLEQIAELEVTPAASAVATAFRGCATSVSDVSSTLRSKGAPADWSGDAAQAAANEMTLLGKATDTVVSSFEKVITACDAYLDQMGELRQRRTVLDSERVAINNEIDMLMADIEASDGSNTAELSSRAQRLMARARDLQGRIDTLWRDVVAAEDRMIASFQTVDTVAEGAASAGDGRTDTEALKRELAALGNDPDAVFAWWNNLSPAQREALKISDPDLIGNTNGIPTGDRDEANRTSLDRDLDLYGSMDPDDLSNAEKALLERAREAEKALALATGDRDALTGAPVDVNLLVYAPGAFNGDGAVAVAFGDPDTADNTAVLVPGLTTDGTSIVSNSEDAYRLFQQAQMNGESAATIAWLGYDAPSFNPSGLLSVPSEAIDVGSVTTEGRAEAGGTLLADFVDGLRASDTGDRSHLSVIGHSYGSTTAAHAAQMGLDADSLTLIGSPGAGGDDVNHASDLSMPPGKVYVGSADNDFVTWLGRDGDLGMGRDPAQSDFGATVFDVDPGKEFDIETIKDGVGNHTSYYDDGSRSLDNLTQIVRGDEPHVIEGRTTPANEMAKDWALDQAGRPIEWVGDKIDQGLEWTGEQIDRGADWAEEKIDQGGQWLDERWQDVKDAWPW